MVAATCQEGAVVGGGVDAVGGAGDDRPAAPGQACGEVGGDMGAVGRGGPGAHHRDRLPAARPQVVSADPQRVRALGAEVIELRWPFGVAGADQADALPLGAGQPGIGGYPGQPGAPAAQRGPATP